MRTLNQKLKLWIVVLIVALGMVILNVHIVKNLLNFDETDISKIEIQNGTKRDSKYKTIFYPSLILFTIGIPLFTIHSQKKND